MTHLVNPLRCLAEISGMILPIIHRICQPDKNGQVNSNVTEHHHNLYHEALYFSLAFSLISRSGFRRVNQENALQIKRRKNNFPLTPIQMTYQYAEMPIIRKPLGYILVFMDLGSMRISRSSDAGFFETLAKVFTKSPV